MGFSLREGDHILTSKGGGGIMTINIEGIMIPVKNQDRALKFYTEKLGYTTVRFNGLSPETDPQRWIEVIKPGEEFGLVLYTHPDFTDMVGKNMNVVFRTNDIQKAYAELKSKDVEFVVAPPAQASWGTYVRIKDSEGNVFCVGQLNKCESPGNGSSCG